jgi:hypothetical protein
VPTWCRRPARKARRELPSLEIERGSAVTFQAYIDNIKDFGLGRGHAMAIYALLKPDMGKT